MNRWATVGRPSGTKRRTRRFPAPGCDGRLEAYLAKDSQTLSTRHSATARTRPGGLAGRSWHGGTLGPVAVRGLASADRCCRRAIGVDARLRPVGHRGEVLAEAIADRAQRRVAAALPSVATDPNCASGSSDMGLAGGDIVGRTSPAVVAPRPARRPSRWCAQLAAGKQPAGVPWLVRCPTDPLQSPRSAARSVADLRLDNHRSPGKTLRNPIRPACHLAPASHATRTGRGAMAATTRATQIDSGLSSP